MLYYVRPTHTSVEPITIVDIPSLLASDIQYARVTPSEVPQSHI